MKTAEGGMEAVKRNDCNEEHPTARPCRNIILIFLSFCELEPFLFHVQKIDIPVKIHESHINFYYNQGQVKKQAWGAVNFLCQSLGAVTK